MSGLRDLKRSWVIAAVAFVLAARPGAVPAAAPEDLDLARAREAFPAAGSRAVPNPHESLPCARCHVATDLWYEEAHRAGLSLPLNSEGGDATLLCQECHPVPHAFHPLNFPVKRLADAIRRAQVFPLEAPVEGVDKLACTSCHAVHAADAASRLLRGYTIGERIGGAPFRTRLDFCRSCHGPAAIVELSGHRANSGETGCGQCHGARAVSGAAGPLKPTLNLVCSICHPTVAGEVPHYVNYNPFPGEPPPPAGRWTCATCHAHHRPGTGPPAFTARFLDAVAKSTLVSPHRSTRFCLGCHPATPPPPGTPGAVAPLRETDVTRLCQGCHERTGALRMDHPLLAPTKAVTAPAGWPLRKDGTLGCQSCHLAGHGPRDPANPRFLRGGPYVQRNEPCRRCHREGRAGARNIHREIADSRGCEFCHLPDDPSAPPEAFEPGALRAEPTLVCLRCHSLPPHPAAVEHTGRPRGGGSVAVDPGRTPLWFGKVTCFSCHDVHEGPAEGKFLREPDSAICAGCHPY